MNFTINILSALLIFAASFNANAIKTLESTEKTAILKFETEIIDYGTIKQNSDGKRIVEFTNEGDAPLIITNVRPSCGCTVANYTKDPIAPGKSGQIEVGYDTRRIGAFNKSVTVTSNAEGGNKTLRIKGVVVAE